MGCATGVVDGRAGFRVTLDEERWAEAIAIERLHGDAAPIHVAERIGALAVAGDRAGIERWKKIAAKLDALRSRGSKH